MDKLISQLTDFASLINTTLLVSLVVFAVRIMRTTLSAKDAQIELLRERLLAAQDFSVERSRDRFIALKEWYELSITELEHQLEKHSDKEEFKSLIRTEVDNRALLFDELSNRNFGQPSFLTNNEMCGTFSVVGRNPYENTIGYFGTLTIKKNDLQLLGSWEIGPDKQRLEGVGFSQGVNIAFVFRYKYKEQYRYGTVLYKFIDREVMRGYWTGFGGSSQLGFEECRRLHKVR